MKRSQEKRITLLTKVIRFMRISRGISQKEAAKRCGLSEQAIGHYEHGRMAISPVRLTAFLDAYGFTLRELDEYLAGKPIPVVSVKDECVLLLDRIDETKLRAVHALLASFLS